MQFELGSNINESTFEESKQDCLHKWGIENNIIHSALNGLLKLLRTWLPAEKFPVDSRTLFKTPRYINNVQMCGGQFYHFGLAAGIRKALLAGIKSGCFTFDSKFEIDRNPNQFEDRNGRPTNLNEL
jgi:hypothetical protein